jgi:ribosomal protein L3 glutamine methyltransferase
MITTAVARARALQVLAGSSELVFGQCSKTAEEEADWITRHMANKQGRLSSDALEAALERRVRDRLPMAHVTGTATLCGLAFKSDRRALIPRSYIAELLDNWPEDVRMPETCLDLCCGNANLAIAAALRLPTVEKCVASDVSREALELAQENVALHRMESRVTLVQSDMFANVSGRFDLILCNPPYVRRSEMKKLPREFKHEPALALEGGSDGLDYVRIVMREYDRFLAPGGRLIMEVGWDQEAALERHFPDTEFEYAETSAGEGPVVIVEKKT